MNDSYDIVLALHVFGAIAWILAVVALELLGTRMRRRGDAASAVTFAQRQARFTRIVALPGSLLLLLSGGWLMHDSGRSLSGSWWLGAGIALWLVAFLGSLMWRGPRLVRAVQAADEHGGDSEDVRWRIRQVLLLGRGELLLLAVALALMLVQPN